MGRPTKHEFLLLAAGEIDRFLVDSLVGEGESRDTGGFSRTPQVDDRLCLFIP